MSKLRLEPKTSSEYSVLMAFIAIVAIVAIVVLVRIA